MGEALPAIVEHIEIDRDMQQVWRVLTSEQSVPGWLGCLQYRCEVGHVFFMQQDPTKAAAGDVSGATQCEILELQAPRLFKFSWFLPGFPATFVSFALAPLDGGRTRVVFTHEGWDQFPAEQIKPIRDMLTGGWKTFVLPGLKRAAEA